MENNPYQSPPPIPEARSNARGLRWAGLLLMAFAICLYIPMTIIPAIAIFRTHQPPFYPLFPAIFNGLIGISLFLVGRWLYRRSLRA